MRASELFPVLVAVAFGIFNLALGLWAFFDTSSFFEEVATFEPYNRHFLHDVGAFMIAIAVFLILAAVWRTDALLAALTGGAVGAVFHWIAHIVDEDLGGEASDPYTLGVIAAFVVAAAVMRFLGRRAVRER